MPTPSKMRRLNEAAELYIEFGATTMRLCEVIRGMRGNVRIEGEDSPEKEEALQIARAVTQAVEDEFHKVLDPYVKKLEEIDQAIKANLPKPPGTIILPGEPN